MKFSWRILVPSYIASALIGGVAFDMTWSGGEYFTGGSFTESYLGFISLISSSWMYALVFGLPGILMFWICLKMGWLHYWQAALVGLLISFVFGLGFFILLPGSLAVALSFLFFYKRLNQWGWATQKWFWIAIVTVPVILGIVYVTLPEPASSPVPQSPVPSISTLGG